MALARHWTAIDLRRVLLAALLLGMLLAAGLATAAMLRPSLDAHVASVRLPADAIAAPFREGQLGGWVVRQPDGSLWAFSAASPHQGQPVGLVGPGNPLYESFGTTRSFDGPAFFRDTIGSIWQLDGTRLFGPAPRGLDRFDISSVEGDWVTVDLGTLHLGACSPQVHFHGPPPCSSVEVPRESAPRPVTEYRR